jgi:recombination protein RecT
MATAAQESANPIAVIRQNLQAMEPEFKAALPPHISPEKFKRVAMTAIQNTPDLQAADRRSLFGSIVKLAQDGLLPDGREAALVIFNAKKQGGGWEKKVQAMPMIAGILKRIRQSGEVARVSAQVVYKNDTFVVKYGFDEDVEHIPPALDEPRGEPIGAYATAVLKDGSKLLEVMSLEEIEKVRAVSRAKDNGPWVAWWSEMARKTVMRRLSKRLPMSTDLEDEIFSRDETMRTNLRPVEQTIDAEPSRPVSRLDAIEHHIDAAAHEEPEETLAVEEQAEALEAEIDQGPAEAKAAEIKAALAEPRRRSGRARDRGGGRSLRRHARRAEDAARRGVQSGAGEVRGARSASRMKRLHLVESDESPIEQEIQRLLIQRRQALQALAWADEELLPLRKRYAAERGEFMLPTIERLQRELL